MEREQLSWQERGQLWLRLIIRLVLAAAAVVLVAKLGPPLLSLFAPFVAALIVAALLNPAVRWLQRRLGWSRKLLSLLLVVVIFGVISGCLGILTYAAANELVSLAQNWSGMLTQVEGFFEQMEALFARAMDLLPLSVVGTVEDTVNALIQRLQAVDPTALLSAAKAATDWAMRVPEFLLALVVFVMASYFLTADYPYHRTRAVQHLDESLLRFLQQVKATALAAFGGYLRAELLLSVGVFFILLGGFLLGGQNYALLLALGLAILDFIPIIGAGTVMVPWAFIALFIGFPVLRLGGDYLGIATLGFAEIIRVLIVNLTPITNGSLGIKGIPFHALALEIRERVKTLVLTGDTARAIRQAVEEAEGGRGCPEIIQAEGLAGAVAAARRAAGPGDVVVLSPACAAFDRFKNFMERGRAFKELVRSL